MTKAKNRKCTTLGTKHCRKPAQWTVVMFGGDRLYLCDFHARDWQEYQPDNVKRLRVRK